MKKIFVLSFILLAIILDSCKKNNDQSNVEPDPDPKPTEFTVPATKDVVMYEVNERAFSSTGDLPGVIQKLDQINSLGINVIWLMPIYPIGQINSVNSPYCVKNYQEVNPEYGTFNDINTLVSEAHDRGMAVILDWVANHTSWDNPWISNKDWYTQDENGNIISPPGTNWADVADLNYDNQEMRLKMIEAMEYWIDNTDIDGFRCDAADFVPFDFWKQAIDSLNGFTTKDLILLAEGARSDHFTAGFDMNFSWDYYNKLKKIFAGTATVPVLYNVNDSEYNGLPDGKEKLRFTTNHDESAWDATPMVLFNGKEGALAASVITIFMNGVPLIYDGQEVGVEDNISFFDNDPIDWLLNPDMLNQYQKILNFYLENDVAKTGDLVSYDHSSVVIFTLSKDEDQLLIIANTRNAATTLTLPDEISGKWIDVLTDETIILEGHVELSAYEYYILKNN